LKADEPIEPKPKPTRKNDISLKLVERKTITEPDRHEAEAKAEAKAEAERAEKAAKEARRLQQARVRALERAANAVKSNTSSSTTVDLPGDSTQAYADYASVVKTVYTDAWRLPEDAANDDANVKVSVTIQRDGRVSEAHIVEKSGDPSLDNSVQRTLDRVHEIEPFPDGATDQERTYIINFNLKAKRQLLG
jgi:TolA protein